MRDERSQTICSGGVRKTDSPLSLALAVSFLAQLMTPVASAAPLSFASHIAAQTPTVTISNPIATPPTHIATPNVPTPGSTPTTPPSTTTASAPPRR